MQKKSATCFVPLSLRCATHLEPIRACACNAPLIPLRVDSLAFFFLLPSQADCFDQSRLRQSGHCDGPLVERTYLTQSDIRISSNDLSAPNNVEVMPRFLNAAVCLNLDETYGLNWCRFTLPSLFLEAVHKSGAEANGKPGYKVVAACNPTSDSSQQTVSPSQITVNGKRISSRNAAVFTKSLKFVPLGKEHQDAKEIVKQRQTCRGSPTLHGMVSKSPSSEDCSPIICEKMEEFKVQREKKARLKLHNAHLALKGIKSWDEKYNDSGAPFDTEKLKELAKIASGIVVDVQMEKRFHAQEGHIATMQRKRKQEFKDAATKLVCRANLELRDCSSLWSNVYEAVDGNFSEANLETLASIASAWISDVASKYTADETAKAAAMKNVVDFVVATQKMQKVVLIAKPSHERVVCCRDVEEFIEACKHLHTPVVLPVVFHKHALVKWPQPPTKASPDALTKAKECVQKNFETLESSKWGHGFNKEEYETQSRKVMSQRLHVNHVLLKRQKTSARSFEEGELEEILQVCRNNPDKACRIVEEMLQVCNNSPDMACRVLKEAALLSLGDIKAETLISAGLRKDFLQTLNITEEVLREQTNATDAELSQLGFLAEETAMMD